MKVNETRLQEEVQALVRIPSIEEVDTVAEHVLARLREAGVAESRRDEDGNVIGYLGEGEGLLLNSHLDTVGVQGYLGDPFAGRLEDGRVVGRGASDCKSGVAAMLEIARLLSGRELKRRLIFAFTVWEEGLAPAPNGSFGAARREDAAEAIVMEAAMRPPSQMSVFAGCRGILRMDIRVRGKACHSSRPDMGDNALYRAAEFVRRFRDEIADGPLPSAEFEVMGAKIPAQCVASLTEIEATQGRNIVPDGCLVGMDCRLLPGQDGDEIVQKVQALAAEFGPGKVEPEVVSMIPGHVCDREALISACQAAAGANGLESPVSLMDGRADSTIFQNEGGIPSVVFGPGIVGQAHTNDEALDVAAFCRGAQACLDAVRGLAEGRS